MDKANVILNELRSQLVLIQGPDMKTGFFSSLIEDIDWDERLRSRKTASFGIPYDYSGISYRYLPLPDYLQSLIEFVATKIGFMPNNCLLNYYPNGEAKMGFHSDNTEILSIDTGIAIFSFGSTRVFSLEHKVNRKVKLNLNLENGSFFYMSQKVQQEWLHAVLPGKKTSDDARISITFRKLKN